MKHRLDPHTFSLWLAYELKATAERVVSDAMDRRSALITLNANDFDLDHYADNVTKWYCQYLERKGTVAHA